MTAPTRRVFTPSPPDRPRFTVADGVILLIIVGLLALGIWAAESAPAEVRGPEISLSISALPFYALHSVGRMAAAYVLSLVFTLIYGYVAAYNPRAERVLMPLLDVLQSVPILSFLPIVLLSLTAILPEGIAVELASIVLIFTSQVWNMTFAWYQSLTTVPRELREASAIFRFTRWRRLTVLELPFGALALIWNSMMSWAGGWFFLMAAEIFTLGARDFRLPGLGAYLQTAANEENLAAIGYGIATLVVVIVLLDQLVWRPLLVWADRFKLEMVESDNPPQSWFYDLVQRAALNNAVAGAVAPIGRVFDALMDRLLPLPRSLNAETNRRFSVGWLVFAAIIVAALAGVLFGGRLLLQVSLDQWIGIGIGIGATFLRVVAALTIALLWTAPLGVYIGTQPRAAAVLQPIVQIVASIPATALFPVLVLALLAVPGGLNVAAVLLMLLGTQWYLLFNVIAGAAAIPQDLRYTTDLLQLSGWQRWRTLILPALFPYLITGMITASGGAWNASIVAEYVVFGGQAYQSIGVGAQITSATADGDYPRLLAATLAMVVTVVAINRLVWRRLYRLAENVYRME
ncbi:ABC transporter permease subunit [Roseiflexus sp.]|uniref:ABC transporter permease n=1 Tax=Roseiflexus sp. TaxID=2562120 RepID=UPI0021DC222F|nr:ABC transporter permease subunit [Roseiflexus sp.]GIV99579.1 MAG: ABC transporter permease [Roseiflexus sp.]